MGNSDEPVDPQLSTGNRRFSHHYLKTNLPIAQSHQSVGLVEQLGEPLTADEPVNAEAGTWSITWRSRWSGIFGLISLVGLIWTSAELWQSAFRADAQETTDATEVAAATPWQSASFPVEDFAAYTSPFGYRDHPYGGRRFHYGLDIAAPMGSYIRAWWEGTAVEVSDDTACGTSIVIESQGWLHIYCHMQGNIVIETDGDRWLVDHEGGIQIRQGDLVKSGQRIGRVGMTGRTTGPHLHWGMKYQGSWVDPSVVIKAMLES